MLIFRVVVGRVLHACGFQAGYKVVKVAANKPFQPIEATEPFDQGRADCIVAVDESASGRCPLQPVVAEPAQHPYFRAVIRPIDGGCNVAAVLFWAAAPAFFDLVKSLHVLHISIDAFSKISVIIRHVDCLPSFIMLSVMLLLCCKHNESGVQYSGQHQDIIIEFV